jgi:hypothetical protein
MAHTITDNTVRLQVQMKTNVPLALRFMLNDIKDTAEPNTPKKTGMLRTNVRMRVNGSIGSIKWGQKYAKYQERGYTSGEVRKYTTPGTGAHFAENAVRRVARRAERHFKRARIVG